MTSTLGVLRGPPLAPCGTTLGMLSGPEDGSYDLSPYTLFLNASSSPLPFPAPPFSPFFYPLVPASHLFLSSYPLALPLLPRPLSL